MTEINFYSKEQTDNKLDEKANSNDVYKKNETYNIEEINSKLNEKIDGENVYTKSETYTKTEINNLVSPKANSTDVYTKTEVNNLVSPKANTTDVYTKTQVDNLVSPKANSSDVYTKSETYTKTEVNNLVSPKANSSDVYTKTEVNNLVSPKANSSDVYTKSQTYSKTETDNLIQGLPVYHGLFKVPLTHTDTITGTEFRITLDKNELQLGDIICCSFQFDSDYTSGTSLMFIHQDLSMTLSPENTNTSNFNGDSVKVYCNTHLSTPYLSFVRIRSGTEVSLTNGVCKEIYALRVI